MVISNKRSSVSRRSPGALWVRRGQSILRSGQRGLDSLGQREEPAVGAALADHHQPDRRRSRRLNWDRDGAAVEEVDDRRVAQDQRVEAPVILVALEGGD